MLSSVDNLRDQMGANKLEGFNYLDIRGTSGSQIQIGDDKISDKAVELLFNDKINALVADYSFCEFTAFL